MRRWKTWAVLAGAAACACVLPESGDSMATRLAGPAQTGTVAMQKTAPANATVGDLIDYRITLTYTGELTGASPAYTITDPLPAEVRFQGWGAVPAGSCPTTPAAGQTGTVSCTVQFTPQAKTVTFTIRTSAAQAGTATNTATLSSGGNSTASTSIAPGGPPSGGSTPAAPGSITASLTGPATITFNECCVPPRFEYAVGMTYTGPTPSPSVHTRFTLKTPPQATSPVIPFGGAIGSCTLPQGVGGPEVSCDAFFTEAQRTQSIVVTIRPWATGVGSFLLELSTGATASVTTTFIREKAPVAPVHPPDPIPGPAAAPTKTVVETMTKEGQAEPQSIAVSPTAKTAQIALAWNDPDSTLDVTAIQLVPLSPARTFAGALALAAEPLAKRKPRRLRISKTYTRRTVDVTIRNLRRGRLKFKIVAVELDGRTRATAKIRQSKR